MVLQLPLKVGFGHLDGGNQCVIQLCHHWLRQPGWCGHTLSHHLRCFGDSRRLWFGVRHSGAAWSSCWSAQLIQGKGRELEILRCGGGLRQLRDAGRGRGSQGGFGSFSCSLQVKHGSRSWFSLTKETCCQWRWLTLG